jgi:hypothetical protein
VCPLLRVFSSFVRQQPWGHVLRKRKSWPTSFSQPEPPSSCCCVGALLFCAYVGRHYSPSSLSSSHFMCNDWHSRAALHTLVDETHIVRTVNRCVGVTEGKSAWACALPSTSTWWPYTTLPPELFLVLHWHPSLRACRCHAMAHLMTACYTRR